MGAVMHNMGCAEKADAQLPTFEKGPDIGQFSIGLIPETPRSMFWSDMHPARTTSVDVSTVRDAPLGYELAAACLSIAGK